MKRLLSYLKPHKWVMTLATVLVLFIIAVELYRPIIIGNAIDQYINGYYHPYVEADVSASDAVNWNGLVLSRDQAVSKADSASFYQIFLWKDHYYMAENLTRAECTALQNADTSVLKNYVREGAQKLTSNDLKVLRQNDFKGILKAGILFLLLLFSGFFLNLADTWLLQKMGQQIVYKLREETFTHIHSLSLSFFNTTPVGKLVTRVSNDTEAVNELFSTILVKLFKNVVKIIGYAVVMLSINVKMASISFLLLPLVAILTFVFRHLSRKAYQITRNKITELNTFLSEHISGMKLIQIFAREKEKYSEFEGKSMELYRANFREIMTFAIFRPSIYLVSVIAMILVIRTGSLSVLNGSLSLGTLFVFITYISSFFEPIQELSEQLGTLQSSIASAEKIFSVLDVKPEIVSPADPAPVNILGEIEFRHVWFAYEEENYILKDVSFVIHPGEKAAFVGATGAGKSTILNLIGRYFDIQKGQILIDGIDIHEIDLDVLRGAIGQVQQDVFIFTGDIKSNISLNNEAISPDDVRRAAEIVNADPFIQKLPHGYDEPVTERGSTLSAGQRQLLSFARTLAYDPKILVLDEATANIDTETETLITQALARLMDGRTTIMVAHRLSTIQHADKIIVMHHGEIKESGTHQELLAKDGLYKKLYELQLMD
ncbi:ABC transporter ATP-binding protein [Coprococcus comes]|uniref:ABC transporter ATP-binding protein n=1 Tax=Coprococcus comes TaxID=410072 RepID=UPI00156F8FB2|nr:ABC transporter ATP-binding protein [Coprococcus comes]MCB6471930.1 ABC transporter ATP-binding protein/permease [Coprococcus comes]NSC15142.1 ABC transporter ATP-binding protein [Coprococcus comes]NSC18300.1 ABC transporter ATP-binding protein [Coprococcus comes]NSC28831.1 ABC transporter ATP-binding protein [Coprococcus comes]NSC66343.1 ABC transporter ATP-binding protein [Coprococcus comes]